MNDLGQNLVSVACEGKVTIGHSITHYMYILYIVIMGVHVYRSNMQGFSKVGTNWSSQTGRSGAASSSQSPSSSS